MTEHSVDHGTFGGLTPAGARYRRDARYHDIVPGRRIVYSYVMEEDGACLSVSLATVEMPDHLGRYLAAGA